jgi:hypothetical protein
VRRAAPPGWSSLEAVADDGSVMLEERARPGTPVVEPTEAGALALGERYWAEVERLTLGLVRTRHRGGALELGALRWTLLRFGAPHAAADGSGARSLFPILGGLLARAPAGSISFEQRVEPVTELRVTVEGFLPRLDVRPGGPLWSGVLFRHVQLRLHTAVGRRYFARLIAEAGKR